MNRRTLAQTAAALILGVCLPLLAMSAQNNEKSRASDAQKPTSEKNAMEEGMKRWQEACTPGEQHKRLAELIGKWDTETRMWMAGPDAPPRSEKGTAEFKWLLDGRWLQQEWQGTMMGHPIKGFGITGYDNYKHKYLSSWVDSLTTTMNTAEGNFDQTGKVMLSFGPLDEPITGEHDKCVEYIWRFLSPDKMVFEVHDLPIGETNTKVVEIIYTRKKS
jgi:hypothetical protein